MKSIAVVLSFTFLVMPCASLATSLCFRRPVPENFAYSTVVVAASATGVSAKKNESTDSPTQTILWRVSKSWKGPYREGSFFTTRNVPNIPIAKGNAMLLFLSDREPYLLDTVCSNSGRLEDSLDNVQILENLSAKSRRSGA